MRQWYSQGQRGPPAQPASLGFTLTPPLCRLPHAPAARGRRLTSLKRGRGTLTWEDRTAWTGQLSLHEKTTPEKRAGNPSLLLWGTDQNR